MMPDTLHARLRAAVEERLVVAPRWRVDFICCGREDGSAEFASWDEADAAREAYCTGPGVDPHGCSGDGRSGHLRAAKVAAANDPAAVIRRCEALLRVVELAEEANNIDEGLDSAKRVGVRDLVAEPLIGDLIVRVLAAGEGIEVGDG